MTLRIALLSAVVLALAAPAARAGGGPLGIDRELQRDEQGIWSRPNQLRLMDGMIAGEFALALWEGGETRLGRTSWLAIDSSLATGAVTVFAKDAFGRERPYQSGNPNQFFRGGKSFPSGEVAAVSSIVTPFVLEYGPTAPAAYALELLPLYDAEARMKSQAHWQTDVLAGFALGTTLGWYAHARGGSFVLAMLPEGFGVGLRQRF